MYGCLNQVFSSDGQCNLFGLSVHAIGWHAFKPTRSNTVCIATEKSVHSVHEGFCPGRTNTDDNDDLLGSEHESRMHTTTATPTFSDAAPRRSHDCAPTAAKPRHQSSSSQCQSTEHRWLMAYSKKRTGGGFRGNTYFPPWKIRDLDPRLHAI